MSFFKRVFSSLCAFAVMALGVFSFAPFSYAADSYQFPFSESELPSPTLPYYIFLCWHSSLSDVYIIRLYESDHNFTITNNSSASSSKQRSVKFNVSGIFKYTSYSSYTGTWNTYSYSYSTSGTTGVNQSVGTEYGVPLPYSSSGISISTSGWLDSFNYSFVPVDNSAPLFWDFSPFYFPEMPHGYFDGNINVVDGSYSLDLSNVTGTTSSSGDTTTFEHYTFTVPKVVSDFDMVHQSQYTTYDGTITSPSYTVTGQTTNTIHYVETGSVDINGSAPVLYSPAYNENSRFRCWSCVMDSSYVWFVSDTRNKITGSIVSVTSDEVTWKYEFADPEGGNTLYPVWGIVFSPMGEVIQVLSPSIVSNKNVFTLTCSIGSLEQDSESGKWSVDPLYHGLWFSQDSPPVQNISYLNVGENKKYLANPIFGESAFQLQFLSSINDNLTGLRSDLASLQSAMTSSISNQTSTFQNMDSASGFDPTDVENMLDYGSLESNYHAPSTDQLFSVSGGSYTDGMAFWRDRMNELLYYSGSPILGLTTFVLTLGLAALLIGRRISGGGTA